MGNSLYQLVLRQKAELRRPLSEPIVGRESLTTLLDALESPLVKVIIGPRRCGKSTLAKLVMRGKACAYLNFEDEGFPQQATGDDIISALKQVYPTAKYYFFDEIQNFPRWESFLSSYLGALWDSIVLKDVVRRFKIRNVQELHDLYTLVLHSVASRFSNDSLVRGLDAAISSPTVKKFLLYGQQAYLFAELPRFHFGARKRLKFDRKAYVYDNGFLTAKKISNSPDYGHLLENAVFIELVRRGFEPNMNLFYYVTAGGYEVDFLTRIGVQNDELIQVAWTMHEQKTRDRELRALAQASAELRVKKIRILTWDHADEIRIGDVKLVIQPVRQWLLEHPAP